MIEVDNFTKARIPAMSGTDAERAERVTSREFDDWFPRSDQHVMLRPLAAPGKNPGGKIVTLEKFFGAPRTGALQ
jgi:hypothetical protein